ncbi:MAG: GNAT family N-acetyltransferase [Polyangiaceae bacterium]
MSDGAMLSWTRTPWAELGRDDLYDALTLRQLVFSVEQACAYLDCDGVDRMCIHVFGRGTDGVLHAYARVMGPGVKYAEAAIGRVVTHPDVRRTGAGRALMRESIACVVDAFGPGPIRIGAQRYLERFYGSFGFVVASEPYLEDGIPHVEMRREAGPPT